jgi:hypothetical protein
VEGIDLACLALDDARFAGELFKNLLREEDFSDGQIVGEGGIVGA